MADPFGTTPRAPRRIACNGAECSKMLGNLKPDILLLDLRMPDKNGLAVLDEVNFNTISTRVALLPPKITAI